MRNTSIPDLVYRTVVNRLAISLKRDPTTTELTQLEEKLGDLYQPEEYQKLRHDSIIRDICDMSQFNALIEPCPVCGLKDSMRVEMVNAAYVLCGRCNICGPGFCYLALIWNRGPQKIREAAIELWNAWCRWSDNSATAITGDSIKSLTKGLIGEKP